MKSKKRIIITMLLAIIIISFLTSVSYAFERTSSSIHDPEPANYLIGYIIQIVEFLSSVGGIILILVGIINFIRWKVKLNQSENKGSKNETEINSIKEKTIKSKSRMIAFIIIGVVLLGVYFLLNIVSNFAK